MTDGPVGPDSLVQRRRLRSELRKVREAAGLTQRDVAAAMDWSQAKLIRIETGAVNISTNDLRALLSHYGVAPDRIGALVDLARAARGVPRWNLYRHVASPETMTYLGYESSASVIRNFEPFLVPDLLQTEEYAREAIGILESGDTRHADELLELRMLRQEILVRQRLPSLHFIMDEAALHRVVGGLAAMRRQLRHLLEMSAYPNVTIRVIPFSVGLYPRSQVPYVLLEFPDPEDEGVLYLKNPVGELILRESSPGERDNTDPVSYLGSFWQLEQLARSGDFAPLVESILEHGVEPADPGQWPGGRVGAGTVVYGVAPPGPDPGAEEDEPPWAPTPRPPGTPR
jgi:transcriptional regulator with XRE-family HTH domain